MPRSLTRRERSMRALYARFSRSQEKAKSLWDHADHLACQIAKKAKGETVRISEAVGIEVVDQFALAAKSAGDGEMPVIWAHGAARQFKIKEVSIPAE